MAAIDIPRPAFMDSDELRMFEATAASFLEENATSEQSRNWREAGFVDPSVWRAAGSHVPSASP